MLSHSPIFDQCNSIEALDPCTIGCGASSTVGSSQPTGSTPTSTHIQELKGSISEFPLTYSLATSPKGQTAISGLSNVIATRSVVLFEIFSMLYFFLEIPYPKGASCLKEDQVLLRNEG